MPHFRQSVTFRKWLLRLEDRTAKARLVRRIERLAGGHAGDHRFLGAELFELRDDFGPGYRIYYMHRGDELVILLVGADPLFLVLIALTGMGAVTSNESSGL